MFKFKRHGHRVELTSLHLGFQLGDELAGKLCIPLYVPIGTVDSEDLKLNRAYIVHFVSLFKVLLSILHLNTIIALFFHF